MKTLVMIKLPNLVSAPWCKRAVLTAIATLTFLSGMAQFDAPDHNPNMWVTDGTVNAIVRSGNTIYLGGEFTYVGPNTGGGAPLSNSTGQMHSNTLNINGTVLASVSDGAGGWFIGGFFTSIGGIPRNRIAHILADNKLDMNWDPNANSTVHTIIVSGSTVYAGGNFTSIGGQIRNRIAALDATTGQATNWSPNANNSVRSIALSGSMVYVAGEFNSIGGQTRNRIAALDATTGQATIWNPNANSTVNTIAINGTTVYVGGSFTNIGGQIRNRIAAFDATTGQATSWNPDAGGSVRTIAVSGTILYAGGDFSSIGGQTRNYIAALNTATGQATNWNPNANGNVYTIALKNDTVYAGGEFDIIGRQTRNRIAALNASTGQATSWSPDPNNTVNSIAISGTIIYAGGSFTSIGRQTRNRIAALDATTGQATMWNPNANSTVHTIAISGTTVYVGGSFTSIGGQTRSNIVALDATTGQATSWNPDANGTVRTIAVSGITVYVGGSFTSIGGQTRNYIAALDAATGQATNWNPNSHSIVNTIAVSGSTIYVGGWFNIIGGQARNHIAALNASTGQATIWNPNANNMVNTIAVSGSLVYIGGLFTNIGGQTRIYIAAIDASTGQATSWRPDPNVMVNTIAISGNFIYVGGNFTSIGGQARSNIAALDATTGQATNWNPNANSPVNTIAVSSTTIYVGGSFSSIGGLPMQSIAALSLHFCLQKPTITASGPTTFCSGGSVTLTAPAGFSYLWSTNETTQSINVTAGGSYTVQTIASGCTSSVSAATVVTVNTPPSTPTISAGGPTTFCSGGSVTLTAPAGFSYLWSTNETTQSINVNTGGSYTVQTIASGCTSATSAATVVTVNTPPSTPTISAGGPTTFCSGGSVTLTAPAGFSYLWSTNETTQSINVTTGGSYTVQTIANGCTSSVSAATVVTVNSSPSTPTITPSGPTTFCSGGSVTLTAPAGFSYLWSTNETTQSINVTTGGSYTVQTIASGCTSAISSAEVVTVTACNAKVYTGIGNWTDAANWSGGTLPVAGDSVYVAPLSSLTMNTTATVKSITVALTGILTMNTTSDLTVTNVANNLGTVANVAGSSGTLRFGGGSFPVEFKGNKWSANKVILLSNAKANADMDVFAQLDLNGKVFNVNGKAVKLRFQGLFTADLLQPAGSALLNANNFKVDKRYPISLSSTGASGGAWILVGAPTNNATVMAWNQGNSYALGTWLNGIPNGGSMFTYDPFYTLPGSRGYKKPLNNTQSAPIGVGHRVWFWYNQFFLGPDQGGQTYTGAPHLGPFNWNLAYCTTGCADTTAPYGYNMIANPYAATIDWDAATGWTRNNVYDAMYIHKSLTQNVASYIAGVGNNGGSRYLSVGQGFFVWANAAGATMTATPQVIVPGVQVAQLRNGQTPDVLRFNVSNGTGIADEAVIRFDQRATPQFDNQLEARKMSNGSGLNLSFLNSLSERTAIMAENLPATQTTYPMSLSVPRTGNYTIQFDGMASLTNNWSVFLKDNDLNTMVPVLDGQGYSFNQSAGTTGRFSLVVMPAGPTNLASNLKLVLNLVPNPAKDVVRVNFSQSTTGMMTVTNQIGQVVMSEQVNGQSHEFSVSKLAKGIYHVAVGGVVTKLVVE